MKLNKILLILAVTLIQAALMAQETPSAPYSKIGEYPSSITSGNVVSRMLDGLAYRYHWVSKDLRDVDLAFEPGNEGKSTKETLVHIYDLSVAALAVSEGKELIRPIVKQELDYKALRLKTLENWAQASKNFSTMRDKDIEALKVVFARGDNKVEYPFWNFLNGQLSDAIYHVGQVVSFRRSSGNPVSKEMNVFSGGI